MNSLKTKSNAENIEPYYAKFTDENSGLAINQSTGERNTKNKFQLPSRVTLLRFTLSQIVCLIATLFLCLLIAFIALAAIFIYKNEKRCEILWRDVRKYRAIEIGSNAWPDQYNENKEQIFEEFKAITLHINRIFFLQRWERNAELMDLLRDNNECAGNLRTSFMLHFGPWNTEDERFLEWTEETGEIPPHELLSSGFYPEGINTAAFEDYVNKLPLIEQKKAFDAHYLVKKAEPAASGDPAYTFIPYSEAYIDHLEPIANSLRRIADLLPQAPTLQTFLRRRADSFFSNDYTDSDIDWLKISDDALIDITIGPYSTSEDDLFNAKAAFEMHVSVKDLEETESLQNVTRHLSFVEGMLPINEIHKDTASGQGNSIFVGNELLNAGYATQLMSASYDYPLDEQIRSQFGSKRVILKNVQRERYRQIVLPIMRLVLTPEQLIFPCFDSFFMWASALELFRGLGPEIIPINGGQQNSTVRAQLREYHDILEELKASSGGVWYLIQLLKHEKEQLDFDFDPLFVSHQVSNTEKARRAIYSTYLTILFMNHRLGGIHFKESTALAFTYLKKRQAITVFENPTTKSSQYAINFSYIDMALEEMLFEVLLIQEAGDYQRARALVEDHRMDPQMQETLRMVDRIETIPVDLNPSWVMMKDAPMF